MMLHGPAAAYPALGEPVVEGWSTAWTVTTFVQCCDGLIGKLDGTVPLRRQRVFVHTGHGLREDPRDLPLPTAVIYLDKSARPVEWMIRALWPTLARVPGTRYTDGCVPPRPRTYFLNIDKGHWLPLMGIAPQYLEDCPLHLLDFAKIDRAYITRIRALFSTAAIDEPALDDAWHHPTVLDGQHVMIVDEVKSSGRTIDVAKRLLSEAIPEATFSGQHWAEPKRMPLNNGVPDKDGVVQFRMEWVPPWYTAATSLGRGVDNRDPEWPEMRDARGHSASNSRTARLGRFVLSTPPHHPVTYERITDAKALQLRDDIRRLAVELREGTVLYRPHTERPDRDDRIARIEAINGMSFDEWRVRRDRLQPARRAQ